MTAMVLHTTLAVVVIAWTYLVTTRVPYHAAWLWAGTGALVVIGYLAVVARYVFEAVPVRAQAVVGHISGTLVALAGVACLGLFALVSARAGRASARGGPAEEGARGVQAEDEPVIVGESDDGPAAGPGAQSLSGRANAPRRALPPDDDQS